MSLGSDSHWLSNIFWTKIEKFYHNVSEGKIGLTLPQYQVSKLKNLYWLFQLYLGMTQEKLKKLVKPQEVYHRTLLDLPQWPLYPQDLPTRTIFVLFVIAILKMSDFGGLGWNAPL